MGSMTDAETIKFLLLIIIGLIGWLGAGVFARVRTLELKVNSISTFLGMNRRATDPKIDEE